MSVDRVASKTSIETSGSENPNVQLFTGVDPNAPEADAPLSRTATLVKRMTTRLSFFSDRLHGERKSLVLRILLVYIIMGIFILGIFSIYWGSMYDRESRYKNLRMLVVIEDEQTVNGIPPAIGNALAALLATPTVMALGGWMIQNTTEFNAMAQSHNNTIFEEIKTQVHHQNYWASIYVPKNASANLYEAIVTGDTSYNVSANSVVSYYEAGRDIVGMGQYVIPNLERVEQYFLQLQANITSEIVADVDFSDVFSDIDSVLVAATAISWLYVDGRPYTNPVLLAPSQVGLIYMIIITFFAFNFFSEIHQSVAKMGVKITHLVTYRIVSTVVSFFVMSFFYSIVSLAFQVNFTVTFGHSGFLVYWSTNFLTMWAVGAMNEAMGMLFIMYYPPLVGFWMLFWVIVNISPTFSPIALCPQFYRYGYAMPIHASYEITKVIFFNTYKGAMGRNYGILVAWVVFASVLMLFMFMRFGKVMGQRAAAQRAQIEKELNEKNARNVEEVEFEH